MNYLLHINYYTANYGNIGSAPIDPHKTSSRFIGWRLRCRGPLIDNKV